ncbi:MAG TPA: LOG family protein [Patescibacteria group bacterium]
MRLNTIAFFGCADGHPGQDHFDAARAVATEIAKSGRTVLNGGGPGVMLAATVGAKEGHGKTQVVYYKPEMATMFEGQAAVNHADIAFEESNYVERTKKLLELGDAYIIFNGGTGTISEFAMAWGVARLYFGHHKPLILYGDFWHDIMNTFKHTMLVRPEEYQVFKIVNTPEQAMEHIHHYEHVVAAQHHDKEKCVGKECYLFLS